MASPTHLALGKKTDIISRAKAYKAAGAKMISVITEKYFFDGDPSFISQIKQAGVSLPILQKDFIIDPVQIVAAKKAGADALLLIARLVDEKTLNHFVSLCYAVGITPVVEIADQEDLKKAIKTETAVIAVNARDLDTFSVNVSRACDLLTSIPEKYTKLGFSGIHSSEEVLQYRRAGAEGVLIGTSLMRTDDPKKLLTSLQKNSRSISDESAVVKICGIRSIESATAAIDAGADFIGLNFVPSSPRYVDIKTAKAIATAAKDMVQVVGIFQNASVSEVNRIAKTVGLHFIQLHGEESPEYCEQIEGTVIKAIRVNDEDTVTSLKKRMNQYPVSFFLLDRENQGKGKKVAVEKARALTSEFKIFLAGGLTPENVSKAILQIKPFAVDVAQGIETNGKEDVDKIKNFVYNAKGMK